MIIRPDDLEIISSGLEFNFYNYTELEINLNHINKDGRSQFRSIEVLNIVTELIDGKALSASDIKEFGDEICSYFVVTGLVHNKKYKVVFCICSDKPKTIGVITLHRI